MASVIRTAAHLLRATDIGRSELVRGELAVMNPAGGKHRRIAMRIGRALADFVERAGLGEVLAAETGFVLSRDPDTVRAPDVSFIRRGSELGDGFVEGAPALAVEVLSPSDRPGYVREKVAEWLESGAEEVWVVDPRERTVAVHIPDEKPRVFGNGDILASACVLPGFELALTRLFCP